MKLSKLKQIPSVRTMVDQFKGYNHNLRIGEGEFYDMTNLSSDNYPVLSTRPKRGVYATPSDPNGLVAKDALCYVDGGDFVINEYHVSMNLSSEPKTLISMGAYVIIMPDKKYINTAAPTEYGNIEAEGTTPEYVHFASCTLEGAEYNKPMTYRKVAPSNPADGDLWLDTSQNPHVVKQYYADSSTWASISTPYIKIKIGDTTTLNGFSVGDGVTISGIKNEKLAGINNNAVVICAKGDDYIVVGDPTASAYAISQIDPITIKRKMPIMDFVIESGNRLWGCRYGTNADGDVVNEIYASKLGDFKNWNCYEHRFLRGNNWL